MTRLLILLAVLFVGCGPVMSDVSSAPTYLPAIQEWRVRTGIRVSQLVGNCKEIKFGCAYEVDDIPGNTIGLGSWKTMRARVEKGLEGEHKTKVAIHEIGHTLGQRHVTPETVMNPSPRSDSLICEPEIWQACTVWPGRCQNPTPHPDCPDTTGWRLYVPGPDGNEKAVEPNAVEERIRRGQEVWGAILQARDALEGL